MSDTPTLETATLLRRSVTRLMRRMRQDRSLGPGKLGVLSLLFRTGPMTPGALAQAEGVQPQSLSRLLADIEAEGLASRRRDARDGRQSLLELTEAGRSLLAADAAAKSAWLARTMDAKLSPTERELLRLAAQLIDRLTEATP
jgi:DNA-binding MarR family transcriptional regulator